MMLVAWLVDAAAIGLSAPLREREPIGLSEACRTRVKLPGR